MAPALQHSAVAAFYYFYLLTVVVVGGGTAAAVVGVRGLSGLVPASVGPLVVMLGVPVPSGVGVAGGQKPHPSVFKVGA